MFHPLVNRWLSIRFNLLSAGLVGAIAIVSLISPNVSAAAAGFALVFASTIAHNFLFMASIIMIRLL